MASPHHTLPGSDDLAISEAARRLVLATPDGLVVADGQIELAHHDITDLAVHPESGRIAALVDGAAIHLSAGDGDWTHVASIGDGPLRVLAWHGDDILVGGANARLWRVTPDGHPHRIDAFDRAPTHEDWHTPWGGPADVYSIASDGSECFVNVHVGGILRSADLGTWAPTIDLLVDVHDVAIDDHGVLWAATGARGLARSTDRGASWTHFTDGLHATYARAVAAVDGGALVSVSSGPFGRDGAVYRLDGDTLTRLSALPDLDGSIDRGRLVADDDVAAIALPSGDVVVSTDGGRSWQTALSGHPDVRAIARRGPRSA
ncbi:MAG: hypothetical protein QNJ12_07655 [Ilumatobacter sp.]|uniref:WD40/YVTN/BNR-like repeat-containing protein n=1 Tax=Ilumatobacter sp. TaxID=1967498 RepID=UPI002628C56E|nr:hypothetical protein [Ilumatobacter sp.]MDJ0768652.1 hypothetical protein [Ilumatobacter sp.]